MEGASSLVFLLVIIGTIGILVARSQRTAEDKYCSNCEQWVHPTKGWSWVGFVFGFGIFYLIYYLFKNTYCPLCHSYNLLEKKPNQLEEERG